MQTQHSTLQFFWKCYLSTFLVDCFCFSASPILQELIQGKYKHSTKLWGFYRFLIVKSEIGVHKETSASRDDLEVHCSLFTIYYLSYTLYSLLLIVYCLPFTIYCLVVTAYCNIFYCSCLLTEEN